MMREPFLVVRRVLYHGYDPNTYFANTFLLEPFHNKLVLDRLALIAWAAPYPQKGIQGNERYQYEPNNHGYKPRPVILGRYRFRGYRSRIKFVPYTKGNATHLDDSPPRTHPCKAVGTSVLGAGNRGTENRHPGRTEDHPQHLLYGTDTRVPGISEKGGKQITKKAIALSSCRALKNGFEAIWTILTGGGSSAAKPPFKKIRMIPCKGRAYLCLILSIQGMDHDNRNLFL
jgi:hypothetical protein